MADTIESDFYSATYSPEDNKLRMYPRRRLSPELYARVKAAGFSWAPKQELFVAPMWTPERAELAEELAGEIGDEDTSLADRAEIRASRFDEYSGKRAAESTKASEYVRKLADGIPLGQPILVGHHSERSARKDAERIENGMRKAVKLWETAEYWQRRAEGALSHAAYKELPGVRMRRIKGIEADLRKVEKNIKNAETIVKAWGRLEEPGFLKKKTGDESTPMERAKYMSGSLNLAPYGTWSALDKGEITPAQAAAQCLEHAAGVIGRCQQWKQHYEFRLAYERAMLGEQAPEAPKYEKGGAVKCWVGRGCWVYIQKVNKVSVTVLDNWGNGLNGKNFTRTIPFDKLTANMGAAEVEAARAAGRISENQFKTGFTLLEHGAPAAPKAPAEAPPVANDIQAMRASLKAGVQVAVAPQLFPTPPAIAERMARLADLQPGQRVLEPSAGTGNLIEAVRNAEPGVRIEAVELNLALANQVASRCQGVPVIPGDFLEKTEFELGGKFDRIVMNPPFENGADIKHILRARELLKPGGILVAICAGGPRQAEKLEPLADFWEPLPAGTFKNAGTAVNTVLLTMVAA